MAAEEENKCRLPDDAAAVAMLVILSVHFFPLPPILGTKAPNFEQNSPLWPAK